MNFLPVRENSTENSRYLIYGIGHIAAFATLALLCVLSRKRGQGVVEGLAFICLFIAFLISAFIPISRDPYLLKARVAQPFGRGQHIADKVLYMSLSGLHLVWLVGIGIEPRLLGSWHRFGIGWRAAGVVLFLLAIRLICKVVRDNPFLTPSVAPQDGQWIVVRGLYGRVRHPMYATVILMSFAGSLITSSRIGIGVSVLLATVFLIRTLLEEKYLLLHFPEYQAYAKRVRYRFLPLVL